MNKKTVSGIITQVVNHHFPNLHVMTSSGRILRWSGRCEIGSLHQAMQVQIGSCDEVEVALSLRFAVHYFQECPLPPGVFGGELDLFELLNGENLNELRLRLGGLNWLIYNSPDMQKELEALFAATAVTMKKNITALASELLADPFRRSAHEYALSVKQSAPSFDCVLAEVSKFGRPAYFRGLSYTANKAAHQIHRWLLGEKRWSEI